MPGNVSYAALQGSRPNELLEVTHPIVSLLYLLGAEVDVEVKDRRRGVG